MKEEDLPDAGNGLEEDSLFCSAPVEKLFCFQLINHQPILELIYQSTLGLIEADFDQPFKFREYTNSECGKKKERYSQESRQGNLDCSKLNPEIIRHIGEFYLKQQKNHDEEGRPMPAALDYEDENQMHKYRIVLRTEERERNYMNPALKMTVDVEIDGKNQVLQVYEEMLSVSSIIKLLDLEEFTKMFESWFNPALMPQDFSLQHLCYTRTNCLTIYHTTNSNICQSIEAFLGKYLKSSFPQQYNPSGKFNPKYKLEQIWSYISTVQTSNDGLIFLKQEPQQGSVFIFFDWQGEVELLEVQIQPRSVESQLNTNPGNSQTNSKGQRKQINFETITNLPLKKFKEMLIEIRAGEEGIGPKVQTGRKLEVTLTKWVYQIELTSQLKEPLPFPQPSHQLHRRFVDLCTAVYKLHSLGITHNQISTQNIRIRQSDGQLCLVNYSSSHIPKHKLSESTSQDLAKPYTDDILRIGQIIDQYLAKYPCMPEVFKQMSSQTLQGKSNRQLLEHFGKFVSQFQ